MKNFLIQVDKGISAFWFWIVFNNNLAIIHYVYWLDERFDNYKFYRRWDVYLDEMRSC